MFNWSFYLQTWVVPMLIVGLIYLVFLIPTYFLIKKYKPSYWLIIGSGVLIVYFVGLILFLIEIRTGYNRFASYLFFSSIFSSLLFFMFFPLFIMKIKKYQKNIKKTFLTYLFYIFLEFFYIYLIFISIAWGASSIIN